MNDQPEVGRPNYSASASRPSPNAVVGKQEKPERRLPVRAVLAALCALFPWAWTLFIFRMPLVIPFVVALLGVRIGLRAKANSQAAGEEVIAVAAVIAAGVFLFVNLSTMFTKYFVLHQSFGSVVNFLLNTP